MSVISLLKGFARRSGIGLLEGFAWRSEMDIRGFCVEGRDSVNVKVEKR